MSHSPSAPMSGDKQAGTRTWQISHELFEHLLRFVPSQGPIKDFIHHNTLHAFQNERFDQGVLRASRLFGAAARLNPSELATFKVDGVLSSEGMDYVGVSQLPKRGAGVSPGWVQDGIRVPGFAAQGVHVLEQTRAPLFRVVANYLDQGVTAHSRLKFDGFWTWLAYFFGSSHFNFELLAAPYVQQAMHKMPMQVIEESLQILLQDPEDAPRYILEILLGHPGWSGLVHQVDEKPRGLFRPKKINAQELVALEIAMDVALALRIKDFKKFLGEGKEKDPAQIAVHETPEERELRLAQDALEWSFYIEKIKKIETLAKGTSRLRNHDFQVVFCIDDRECSIRRHLESLGDNIQTYGAAGFFGLDCMVLEAGYPYMVQSCPVVLDPKVLIEEVFVENSTEWLSRNFPKHHHHHLSRTFTHPLKGALHSFWKGISLARHLVMQVFAPDVETSEKPTNLQILYRGDRDGMRLGYSREEMADRVAGVLKSIGLQRDGAKLVVIMAHESSSNNNPHYAAYDCGACSGRSGAQNARAFAMMANDPDVRKLLALRGVSIPDGCHFVGAVHNTTRDDIKYFDLQELSGGLRSLFEEFVGRFEKALSMNAKERTRKFELFPQDGSLEEAREHVLMRSVALFEPRPELNHATNAMCVVGRRQMTAGASFDRRSFLHSYDPVSDPEGMILSGILNAVVPVCGGINLEYYFSRMDNQVYGAGTKLPHNVVGLFGVSNGVVGDLRTGLPSQMIEVHDPLRLMVLVEQSLDIALAAVKRNAATFEWVENEWIHYACFNIADKKVYRWCRGEWKKVIS